VRDDGEKGRFDPLGGGASITQRSDFRASYRFFTEFNGGANILIHRSPKKITGSLGNVLGV
jgi:hypothetical protein